LNLPDSFLESIQREPSACEAEHKQTKCAKQETEKTKNLTNNRGHVFSPFELWIFDQERISQVLINHPE
jgi:hypothetical protein